MTKKLWTFIYILLGLFFFIGVSLLIPEIQKLLVVTGGKILGRPLNNVYYWESLMVRFSIFLFSCCILGFWLWIRSTETYQFWLENQKNLEVKVCALLVILCFVLFLFPFIIFGQDSVITVHDNLDDSVSRFHYLHQNHLFWSFSRELPVMNGSSLLFFNREGYTVYNAIYCLLPTYAGYVVNHVLCVVLGFLSMFFLQRILFKRSNSIILTITALAYSLLPTICVYKMGVATLPFAIILFYELITSNEKRWLFLSFLYPFFTELSAIGLFVCGFWLLAIIIISVKNKKIKWNVVIGLVFICIGFGITNSRLIYMRFVINEPLNRDFMTTAPVSFVRSLITYFFSGYYHSATLQNRLVDWVNLCVTIVILRKHIKGEGRDKDFITLTVIGCLAISLFCSFVAALSDAKIMDKIVNVVFPPLKGVSFARIYMISRVTCYVAFTASLLYIANKEEHKGIAYSFAILQLVIIFLSNTFYSDSELTWKKNIVSSNDISWTNISWKEFFSEKQFSKVKDSINYSGEPVCAVGYHPSVLLYNDFNTIDGYLSVYPRRQQLLWHNLMEPEFERNEQDKNYFDSWGGRRYVYNKDLSWEPTREKYHDAVDLYINMDILKKDFGCKYILSRAELSNADELGLKNMGVFDFSDSIYCIWVYEVK